MPVAPESRRPQTLKQAKKAFSKAGRKVGLTESELAVIERRAVLQERADRIKEREAKRKANIKRKEERNQKERETRQRMGLPSPVKGGIHVGPSQSDLGQFLGGVVKGSKTDTEPVKALRDGNLNGHECVGRQSCAEPMGPPARRPLKEIPPNIPIEKPLPATPQQEKYEEVMKDDMDLFFVSNTQIERELSPPPTDQQPLFTIPTEPNAFGKLSSSPQTQEDVADDILAQLSTQDLDFAGVFTQAPAQCQRKAAAQVDWASDGKATSIDWPSQSILSSHATQAALLADVSTQGFDFMDELSQPPKKASKSPAQEGSNKSFDFGDGPTDGDLNDLALELDLDSSYDTAMNIPQKPDNEPKSVVLPVYAHHDNSQENEPDEAEDMYDVRSCLAVDPEDYEDYGDYE